MLLSNKPKIALYYGNPTKKTGAGARQQKTTGAATTTTGARGAATTNNGRKGRSNKNNRHGGPFATKQPAQRMLNGTAAM